LREIYLDNLQRYPNKGINWSKSIGLTINFVYDDIKSSFKILNHINGKLQILYNDKLFLMRTSNITRCNLGNVIGVYNLDYIYNIGDIIGLDNSIQILNRVTKTTKHNNKVCNRKAYECKCLKCGANFIKIENDINKSGCPCCGNSQLIIKGINDIATTNSLVASWMENENDRYTYSQHSNKQVQWCCPNCGEILNKRISDVTRQGLCCSFCNDGISIPEKMFRSLCVQLKELDLINNFETQYSPEWAKNLSTSNKNGDKYYDFKISGEKKCICEIHGGQHYIYTGFYRSLEEEQLNDEYKEKLAKQNIDYPYIILDVRESTIEWFKDSVINSILPKYYNFIEDMIDWDRINEETFTSIKKVVWDLWDNGTNDLYKISEISIINVLIIPKFQDR